MFLFFQLIDILSFIRLNSENIFRKYDFKYHSNIKTSTKKLNSTRTKQIKCLKNFIISNLKCASTHKAIIIAFTVIFSYLIAIHKSVYATYFQLVFRFFSVMIKILFIRQLCSKYHWFTHSLVCWFLTNIISFVQEDGPVFDVFNVTNARPGPDGRTTYQRGGYSRWHD